VIVLPPAGAAALKTTVPVEGNPPITLVGLRYMEEMEGRVVVADTVRFTFTLTPSKVAEISGHAVTVTGVVAIVKFVLVASAGTVTLAGTVATAGVLLESVTVIPPAGAGVARVTVPVEAVPPATVAGLKLRETRGECWNRPVGLQLAPPSVLLNTPKADPAYRVFGASGSIARCPMPELTP
jgi:hypothetical protein